MFLVYEKSGQLKTGRLVNESDWTSPQKNIAIYDEQDRKTKVKRDQIILTHKTPLPNLIEQAEATADTLDIDLLWSCSSEEEQDLITFAQDYFGQEASHREILAILIKFQTCPVYFHRKSKGRYKRADETTLQLALQAIEKKKIRLAQQAKWTEQLISGKVPEGWNTLLLQFLEKPDKNTDEWKAFEKAMEAVKKNIPQMLLFLKVFSDPLLIFHQQFQSDYFPKGTDFDIEPDITVDIDKLSHNAHPCYSIDSIDTDEIDDAISCEPIDDHHVKIGVHIAVPALGIEKDSPLDHMAQNRMSTVYTPNHKITMLPKSIIQQFSLDEGEKRPALSVYAVFNLETGKLTSSETKLQTITVTKNLRTEHIDGWITELAFENDELVQNEALLQFFQPLWIITQHLSTQRDEIRGRAEQLNRLDYSVILEGHYKDPNSKVSIKTRPRTAPTHRIVQELMIFANMQWAEMLKNQKIAGIFRSQSYGRTRMSTYPNPHEGIGAEQYIWATSPLRRYPDLLCQRQLICIAKHGVRAALVTPYEFKDPELIKLIGLFEERYNAYGRYQRDIETYWFLKFLQQENITELEATVLRNEQYVRLDKVGLNAPIQTLPSHIEPGDQIFVKITHIDLMSLSIELTYLRQIEATQ